MKRRDEWFYYEFIANFLDGRAGLRPAWLRDNLSKCHSHYDLPMPKLAEHLPSDAEVKFVRWLVHECAPVSRGTAVAVVKTGSTSFVIKTNGEGTLRQQLVSPGETLREGATLAVVGADGENIPYGRPYSTCELLDESTTKSDFDRELDADVNRAAQSIRDKADHALARAQRDAKRSLFLLFSSIAVSAPFMKGMPLHAYFSPLGQFFGAWQD